jgi:hypothetical protein
LALTSQDESSAGTSDPASLVAYEFAISGKPRQDARTTLEGMFGERAAEEALARVYPVETPAQPGLFRRRPG